MFVAMNYIFYNYSTMIYDVLSAEGQVVELTGIWVEL